MFIVHTARLQRLFILVVLGLCLGVFSAAGSAVENSAYVALENDDLESFRRLAQSGKIDIHEETSPREYSYLMSAVFRNAENIVGWLIEQGVDLDHQMGEWTNALYLAYDRNNEAIYTRLLQAGADPRSVYKFLGGQKNWLAGALGQNEFWEKWRDLIRQHSPWYVEGETFKRPEKQMTRQSPADVSTESPTSNKASGQGLNGIEKLRALKQLLDEGVITEEEFVEQKTKILQSGL